MNTATSGITCVGILCADILGKPVDRLPEKGKLSLVDNISLQAGGCAANVAMSLARIGMRPAIAGKVGDDSLGRFLLTTLGEAGVDVRCLRSDPLASTAASMVLISGDSERSIVHSMGANRDFCYEDIDLTVLDNTRILLIAGTFLMPGFDGAGTVRLLAEAKKRGITCCLDTAWDSTGAWMQHIEPALAYLDWFMPSYDEAKELSGATDPAEMAAVFQGKGAKNIIIKLNRAGCYVRLSDGEHFNVPSYNRVRPVDTSGAGDSFCAGFLTGLLQGWDVRRSAAFANATGAHCIMEIGTTSGIRPLAAILAFMDAYGDPAVAS